MDCRGYSTMEQQHVTRAEAGPAVFDVSPGESLFRTRPESNDPAHAVNRRDLLKRAVASLPRAAIVEMERRELIFAIRTAELPWLNGAAGRLEYADRPTLERLVFLARRVCRQQLNDADPPVASHGRPRPRLSRGRAWALCEPLENGLSDSATPHMTEKPR
ncbi:MAG TPA: hypothetical protein VML55_00185 [Planctomycetaceae bacterium]|nr:hypothetical protein [Planctomycetaceae bacterium]